LTFGIFNLLEPSGPVEGLLYVYLKSCLISQMKFIFQYVEREGKIEEKRKVEFVWPLCRHGRYIQVFGNNCKKFRRLDQAKSK